MIGTLQRTRDRRALQQHVRAAAGASVRPVGDERTRHVGLDPVHVLLIGSGVAVGYGARTRAEALDGRLAQRLGERLGRGVVVVNEAAHGARLADQVLRATIGLTFAATHLLVWCPSFLEMADRRRAGMWETQLSRLLEQRDGAPMLVLELPVPLGDEPAARTAAPLIARINARLHAAAAPFPNVLVVRTPSVRIARVGEPLFSPAYHAELGDGLAEAAVLLLHRSPSARSAARA